jgi:phosphoribosyl 1,2-cyclic phosphodiesterase
MGGCRLLVDAGISTRRMEKSLAAVGVNIASLDGVLITHEHQDHIKGLDVLVRKYKLPVYTRPATWQRLPCRTRFPGECCRDLGEELNIGRLKVEVFSTSHDAADPVGFAFHYKDQKCVVATDLGVATPAVRKALAYADLVVLEANHDIDMLKQGPYPQFLKQRISGVKGHLSNHEAAGLLASVERREVMQVFLAHLSRQNNNPRLAHDTVSSILQRHGCETGREIILHHTYPDCTASLCV